MKTDNRTSGGRFEREMAKILSQNGFWCHLMTQSKAGQPADLIAVRGDYHTLIDCKVLSDGRGFPFTRAEENQRYAMERFFERGEQTSWFALKLPDGSIRMLSYPTILALEMGGAKAVHANELEKYTMPLEEWMNKTGRWVSAKCAR